MKPDQMKMVEKEYNNPVLKCQMLRYRSLQHQRETDIFEKHLFKNP